MSRSRSTHPHHRHDLLLVRKSIAGDQKAAEKLAHRLACVPRILMSLARRIGRPLSGEDLADLAQDVVMIIWRKRVSFEGRARLETWAYRICFLEFMNWCRSRGRFNGHDGTALDEVIGYRDPRETSAADLEIVERGLVKLGPPEEDVIRLKHYEERTFKEIGAVLDISPNTAKSHYYRGMAWLRRHLAPSVREASR